MHNHSEFEWVAGEQDESLILLAAQHFLGVPRHEMESAITSTLEGHQRQILGTLTVEELYQDTKKFAASLREHATADLMGMGIVVQSYVIPSIKDDNGYMADLGVTRTAAVKAQAEIGKAENDNAARQQIAITNGAALANTSVSRKHAHIGANLAAEDTAISDRDLALARALNDKDVNVANVKAAMRPPTQRPPATAPTPPQKAPPRVPGG